MWNKVDYAVEGGREVARRLAVEHTIHLSDGDRGKELVRERSAPEGLAITIGRP